jgi:cardiolipin synthase
VASFIVRLLKWAVVAVVMLVLVAACRILQFQREPAAFPPGSDALSPLEAQAATTRIVASGSVERQDIALTFAPTSSTSAELLIDGPAFYPRILQDLSVAQSSIHIDQYGFTPGEVADRFVEVLSDRVRTGVEVRVVVDRLGSSTATSSRDLYAQLRAAGVTVVTNDPLVPDFDGPLGQQWVDIGLDEIGHLYHRKLFVVDGRIGWVGGAGIEDYFDNGSFHDVFVRVEGAAVPQLQTVFLTSYAFHGGPLPADVRPYFPETPVGTSGGIRTSVLQNVPGGPRPNTDAIEDLIRGARATLDIMDPYVSDRATLAAIGDAAKRGVRVRFIVPLESNAWPVQQAFNSHIDELQNAGVQVLLHPILPHAKVVLADDRVLVGSTNLDAWALYRNWELSLLFEDRRVVEMFEQQLFDPDAAASTPAAPPTGAARLVSSTIALFSPLL